MSMVLKWLTEKGYKEAYGILNTIMSNGYALFGMKVSRSTVEQSIGPSKRSENKHSQ